MSLRRLNPVILAFAAIAPLVLGGVIYVAFRPTSLLMFEWFDATGLAPLVAELRNTAHPFRPYLVDWALYSFPQGAWVWFGTAAFLHIWPSPRSVVAYAWVFVPCCLAVAGEAAQGLHLVTGTFDAVDVGFSLLAFVAALWFHFRFGEHQQL